MNLDYLSEITVIDMTEGVAGPYAASMLGDMGANVIKVERAAGDWSRTAGQSIDSPNGSPQFIALNRNKRDISVEVDTPEGYAVLSRMISRADVVLSNFRAGVMDKLRLGYTHCEALQAKIIYCTISGFGQQGPYANFPASDTILQALSGMMNQVGETEGPPLRVGFPLIDITAAHHAVQAILLALLGRVTGKNSIGKKIDISLIATALGLMNVSFTDFLITGKLPQKHGNQNAAHAPAGAFKTKEGAYITIAILRDSHWKKFCQCIERPDLTQDPHFTSNALRIKNREPLNELIATIIGLHSSDVWLEKLQHADILCGPIQSFKDIAANQHLTKILPLVNPHLPGIEKIYGNPIHWDDQFFDIKRSAPVRGQHTREILIELEYSQEEIEQLLASGSLFQAPHP
jgi:crotonobetainyl-CoA:carnitine CoA-transferase CaiB-like acyl-CoA transferase